MPDRDEVPMHPHDELILYVYDELPPASRAEVEAHLARCEKCRKEIDGLGEARDAVQRLPLAELSDETWIAMLRRATVPQSVPVTLGRSRRKSFRRTAYAAIAAATLVTVGALGAYVLGATRTREVQRLQSELAEARVAATVALLREPRSADRLRGVSFGSALLVQDARITAAFTHALRTDPSPNVRLAVLDAVEGTARQPGLDREILTALPEEPLPAVRLAMIDLLGRRRDTRARSLLEMIARTDPDVAVRARARSAAATLTTGSPSVPQ